ncbi:MAG: O-antigen ligase family protein [Comamonas sp.]|nr:O-antigen ligase family protein [Comamonas sp.]
MYFFYLLSASFFFVGVLNPFHIPPWNSFHSEFLCALAIVSLLLFKSFYKNIEIPKKFLLLIAVILIYIAIQLIAKNNSVEYKNLLVYFAIYSMALIAGFNTKEIKENNILNFIISIGFFLSISVLAQFFDITDNFELLPSIENTRRPGGSLIQANHAATFICMGLICCLQRNFSSQTIKLIIFTTLSFALAATESRTGLLAFSVYILYASLRKYRKKIILFPSLIFVCLSFLLTPKIYDTFYQNQIESYTRVTSTSSSGRLLTWPILIDSIKEKPITGHGFNSVFSALDNQIRNNENLRSAPFHYSHNIIIDFLIWFGIPVTILMLIFSSKILLRIENEKNDKTKIILIPLILHALLEYPHAYMYFGIPFLFIIGRNITCTNASLFSINKLTSTTLIILISVPLINYSILYINSEELIRSIRFKSIGVVYDSEITEKQQYLNYFEPDEIVSNIKINKDISPENIENLRRISHTRPSKTYESKYAEALYASMQCPEYSKQIRVIESYYDEEETKKITELIKFKHQDVPACSH